jgi:hypothetical protein
MHFSADLTLSNRPLFAGRPTDPFSTSVDQNPLNSDLK